MGAKVGVFSRFPDHSDVTFLAGCRIHSEELILAGVDLGDGGFSGHPPAICRGIGDVPDVGYMLMRTAMVRLVYAGDLVFRHTFVSF
jgi:hypothetical protein